MNNSIGRVTQICLFAMVLIGAVATTTYAQANGVAPGSQSLIFKVPDGFMAADFAGEKRTGTFMLDPKKPAGVYITYAKEGESLEDFIAMMQKMTASMFLHDESAAVTWTATLLPAHEKVEHESGKIYSTASGGMELQLVEYTRVVGSTTIYYGYFGMRHQPKKGDDAPFMDAAGKGVSKFDKFWKTISVG